MRARGFTFIELLLVLFLVALLASIVAPVVTGSLQRARESTLREDLRVLRKAIDDHYADTGLYPATLDDLVSKRYLRAVPVDPVTGRADSWVLERASSGATAGISDVRSGSEERDGEGVPYREW
jgi:prepilin-type N-terminal cleavage/methylation domain-containing protein